MITLFTGDTCVACKALKGRLTAMGLTGYQEANVSNVTHKTTVTDLGFRGIPLLVRYDQEGGVEATLLGNTASDADYQAFFSWDFSWDEEWKQEDWLKMVDKEL